MSDHSEARDGRTSRVLTLVGSFLIGALYGALATTGHRHAATIGGVSIPWGLVLALLGVGALLVAVRIAAGRAAAIAASLGLIIMVAVFTLPGLGGTVLVVGDLTGTIWSIGPALIAVLVVAWPKMPAARHSGIDA